MNHHHTGFETKHRTKYGKYRVDHPMGDVLKALRTVRSAGVRFTRVGVSKKDGSPAYKLGGCMEQIGYLRSQSAVNKDVSLLMQNGFVKEEAICTIRRESPLMGGLEGRTISAYVYRGEPCPGH